MTQQAERVRACDAREGDGSDPRQRSLVARAQAGDAGAFEALVAPHLRRVYRLVYRFCWDHEDANDITQETFVRAFRYIGRFRAGSEFGSWLYGIAINRCLSHRARRDRAREAEARAGGLTVIADDIQGLAQASVVCSRVREEMERLPQRQRAAIVLFEMEGLSVAETAQIMGCSRGTVKRHLHRARAALRERLVDLLEDASEEGR